MAVSSEGFAGRRVLVTGGAGFVGSHVADRLLAEGAEVTILDDFSTGWRQFVPARARLIEGDLLDAAAVARTVEGRDFVFHLAANADIKDNLLEPRKCIDQNVVATQNLLETMRAAGVREVAFASTGSVYGDASVVPTPEDAPFPVQTSLYATSKLAAEGLLTSYALGYGFRTWIFRFVSLLGPRYTHGHVIDFWRRLRRDPTRLDVLGDGHQKKSYLHVADCVSGMWRAIARAWEPINVFNLGHQDWIEVDESIAIIVATLGVKPRIVHAGGDRGWVGDSPRILLDTTRLRALGWAPTRSIEESIVETLSFLEASPYVNDRRSPPEVPAP
ncbi:MAG TPA: NAD-dependent epimerase/dehydratase family protein [Myxococcaceae bacterium]|nr:NAD-dependent epimerase/dehydratase family protein [Myxococcaceae bacterium]